MAPKPGDVIPVTIEAAMGADLTASAGTWSWTDLSARLLGEATIVRGRADEAQQTQPATLTVRLRNTDGRLTPRHPSSPWYLLWKRGVPIRLKVTVDGVTYTRFQGRATVIKPVWPAGNSEIAFVDVTAKGALYVLQQGRPPSESPLFRAITAQSGTLRAYWPMEDSVGSVTLASGMPGGRAALLAGLNLAADSSEPGSFPLPTFSSTGTVHGNVSGPFASQWQVDWYYKIADPVPNEAKILTVYTGDASGAAAPMNYDLYVGGGGPGGVVLRANNSLGAIVINSGAIFGPDYFNAWIHARIMVRQSGGNIQWQLVLFPIGKSGAFIGSTVAGTVAGPNAVGIQPNALLSGMSAGHLAVWDAWDLGAADQAQSGFSNELVTTRLTRLCADAGVPITITGTTTTRMGPQQADTLNTLLRQAEDADLGILTDGVGPGLGYLARAARYNLPVALALDAARGQVKWPPFEPVEDDQRLRTRFTVTRIGGSSATYTDPSATTEGEYPGSATVNVVDDTTLAGQASWRTHLFTPAEMRAPVSVIDVRNSPELLAQWLAMDIGERYTIANPPAQYPPGGLDLVLEQYTEVIDGITWRVTLTGSPYDPWRVMVVGTDRVDTGGSQLTSAITTTATSISITTTAGLAWGFADGAFDINVGGERMTVTAIAGATSPQTFTVTRSVNGVVKAHNANAAVRLWKPAAIAL